MSKENHDERAARTRQEDLEKPWIQECVRLMKSRAARGGRVLEIGCGNGETADILSRDLGCQMSCLDYAPSHLARVRAKGHETISCNLDSEDEVRCVETEKQGQYDVVVSLEVIEHLFEPDVVFRLAHAVLKPQGLLLISTPNLAYIGYRLYSLFRGNLPPAQGHHISFFNGRRLWQQLFICGFEPEPVVHFGSGEFYLDRAVGRHGGWIRRRLIRGLFLLGLYGGPDHLRSSGLIGIGRKSNVLPLALSSVLRKEAYGKMTEREKVDALKRIEPDLLAGHFDEHPDFMQFCENELHDINIRSKVAVVK